MKSIIYIFSIIFIFSSCKDNSNPIKTDPPNPYAQKEIDWPSLQKAPWPMYRHDPQLTGRSSFVGPIKGIIIDTIKFWVFSSSVAIDKEDNVYIPFSFDSSADICSYNVYTKTINWRVKLPINVAENPNTPSILLNGNILYSGKRLYSLLNNGSVNWSYSTVNNDIIYPHSQIDKFGNIYFVEAPTLYCISSSGQLKWSFTYPGIWQPKLAFSPDGKTLYIPLAHTKSIVALDVESQNVKWTTGSMPLYAAPILDNNGNIYFQKKSGATSIDTFYCIDPLGNVRWEYIYHKGNSVPQDNWYYEPTIDNDGNIYFVAPKDTLVSVTNEGHIRWKLSLNQFNGSFSPLVCDALNTVYLTTGDSHLIAISQKGVILWRLKFNYSYDIYGTPSLMNGKMILITNSGYAFIIE